MVAEPAESTLGLESFEFRLAKTRYQRKLERLGLTLITKDRAVDKSLRSEIDKGELLYLRKTFQA